MTELFNKLLEVFSIEYMFSVVICSYLILKGVDAFNGKRVVPLWTKRLVTCVVGGCLFIVFERFTDVSTQSLIASFFSAVFLYDVAIKVLLEKFKIGYRK